MKNYIQEGKHLTITSNEKISSGSLYVHGKIYGIAFHDATQGGELTIATEGVYRLELPKGFNVGEEVFFTKDKKLAKEGDLKIGVVVDDNGAVLLR